MDDTSSSQFGRATVDGLVALARDLSQTSDMATTLKIFVKAITDLADFECAAINLVNDDGDMVVVAVAGPAELEATLLGTVGTRAIWDREIALADRHGAVHLSLSVDVESTDDLPVWVSDDEAWFARTADNPKAWRPEYALYVPMFDGDGELLGVVSVDLPRSGLMPDHDQLATLEVLARQAETAIASAQTLDRTALDEHVFGAVFEVTGSAMCIADGSGRLTQTNRQFRDTFGDIADVRSFDLLAARVEGGESLRAEVNAAFDGHEERSFVAATGLTDDLSWFHVTIRGVAYLGSSPVRAICTMVDITGERRVRHQFQHDAEHDPLTGLLNRRGVRAAAQQVVKECMPRDFLVAMFCDLDGFKQVNDQHGHSFGDRVLAEVTTALRAAVPEPVAIGRVGGDEFVIFAACSSIHEAQKLADTVVGAIAVPVPGSPDIVITTTVGMAMDDSEPRREISELMKAADEALYRAKIAGGARWMSAPVP